MILNKTLAKALLPGVQGILFLTAASLAMSDMDNVAWITMNISILAGILIALPAWNKKSHLIIGSGLAFLKSSLVIYFAYGWWTIRFQKEMPYEHPEFFWLLSPFLLITGIFEILSIKKLSDVR
jgi:hypothetical protein